MRFISKIVDREAWPGQYRSKSRFLFFPKKIGRETRWLEFAKWTEEYRGIAPYFYKWIAIQWS